jgi:hypothetical protein
MLCVLWNIWLQRNDRVFHHHCTTAVVLVSKVWEGMSLWCCARLVVDAMLIGA